MDKRDAMKSTTKTNGKWHKRLWLSACVICGKSFRTEIRRDPACGDACWRKLVALQKAGEKIPGLLDRVNAND
jgi:hypothetical protein